MEIEKLKVPETIKELNEVGFWLKIIEEDLQRTLDRIEATLGEDAMEDWLNTYSDYNVNRVREVYRAGATALLREAIQDATKLFFTDEAIDCYIYWALQSACEEEQKAYAHIKEKTEDDTAKEMEEE